MEAIYNFVAEHPFICLGVSWCLFRLREWFASKKSEKVGNSVGISNESPLSNQR